MKKATTILALCFISSVAFGCAKKEHANHDTSNMSTTETAPVTPTDTLPLQDVVLAPQTTCPIMDEAIDSTLFVEQDGKRIYVCCNHCVNEVKKDFSAAEKKLTVMGQKPELVQ